MTTTRATKSPQERQLELNELVQSARVKFRAIDTWTLRTIMETAYQLGFDHGMEVGYDGGFEDGRGVKDMEENETGMFEEDISEEGQVN